MLLAAASSPHRRLHQHICHRVLSTRQIGGYFGAELCSFDVNSDGNTDFLLVGAPLFYQPQQKREGQIHVYGLTKEVSSLCCLVNRRRLQSQSARWFGFPTAGAEERGGGERLIHGQVWHQHRQRLRPERRWSPRRCRRSPAGGRQPGGCVHLSGGWTEGDRQHFQSGRTTFGSRLCSLDGAEAQTREAGDVCVFATFTQPTQSCSGRCGSSDPCGLCVPPRESGERTSSPS